MDVIKKIISSAKQEPDPVTKKEETHVPVFIELLSDDQKEILEQLGSVIKKEYPDYEYKLFDYYFGIKRKKDNFYCFWFARSENQIVFKYRKAFQDESAIYTYEKPPFEHITEIKNIIYVYIKENEYQKPRVKKIINDWLEKEDKPRKKQNNDEEEHVSNLVITTGKKFVDSLSVPQLILLNDFREYVLNKMKNYIPSMGDAAFLIKREHETFPAFWFCIENNYVVFKYRDKPTADSNIVTFEGNPFDSVAEIEQIMVKKDGYYSRYSNLVKTGISIHESTASINKPTNSIAMSSIAQNAKLVDRIHAFIESNYTNIERTGSGITTAFSTKNGECTWFWFLIENNVLCFKYREQPYFSYQLNNVRNVTYQNIDEVEKIVQRILDNNNEVVRKKERTSSVEPNSFTSTRSFEENTLIREFEACLKIKINDLIVLNGRYTYSFKVLYKEETYTLCWFVAGEHQTLLFKFYPDPANKELINERIARREDCPSLATVVNAVYLRFIEKNEKKIENNIRYSNEKIDPDDSDRIINVYFYDYINFELKNKTPRPPSKQVEALYKSVAEFVNGTVMNNAISNKECKSKEDYDKFKYSWRFRGNFFGHVFTFKTLDRKDAAIFFNYYVASVIIDEIKKYESHMNKEIINNQLQLIHSLSSMVSKKTIDYSKAKGLNSCFGLYVPTSTLNSIINKIYALVEVPTKK